MTNTVKFEANNLAETVAKKVASILVDHDAGILIDDEHREAVFHIVFDDKSALLISYQGFKTGHIIFNDEVN
jgi:frataxin-like iron-binding protein CyaY